MLSDLCRMQVTHYFALNLNDTNHQNQFDNMLHQFTSIKAIHKERSCQKKYCSFGQSDQILTPYPQPPNDQFVP